MTVTIKYWCDSGANIHSCRKGSITLDELGFTETEWDEMPEDQRDEVMKEIAFERLDWGYAKE